MATWLNRDSASFDDLHADCATALRQLAVLVGEPSSTAITTDGIPHE